MARPELNDETKAAWAAGLFEGEGCICIADRGRYVLLSLASTDHDVLETFKGIVGCGQIRFHQDTPNGISKRWQTAARDDVLRVIRLLKPWLHGRRFAAALRAEEHIEELVARG